MIWKKNPASTKQCQPMTKRSRSVPGSSLVYCILFNDRLMAPGGYWFIVVQYDHCNISGVQDTGVSSVRVLSVDEGSL